MTRYYSDAAGNYLGAFDGAEPPAGAIERPTAPRDAAAMWSDGAWVEPGPAVPQTVSRFQAKAAMSAAGLLTSVEAAVTAEGGIALLAWNEAVQFERSSPTIAALQGAVGLSDTQIDDLFRSAALISA